MSATVDAHSCLSLVALITLRDLLLCAKHLFVAARGGWFSGLPPPGGGAGPKQNCAA